VDFIATKAFKEVKKLIGASVMRLLDFSKVFEVTCDSLGLVIGGVVRKIISLPISARN